jgi:hypothetical protein
MVTVKMLIYTYTALNYQANIEHFVSRKLTRQMSVIQQQKAILCMYNNKAWEEILLAKKVFD